MGKSLVAFDTDHIKSYVFATNRLKEIRGASSILDRLNRVYMSELGEDYRAEEIYALGGSGLFIIEDADADRFGHAVQRKYLSATGGRASVTYVKQAIPDSENVAIEELKGRDIKNELTLIRYKLRQQKGCPPPLFSVPSHPFMRHCDACGIDYSERFDDERHFCSSCWGKQEEDTRVKKRIKAVVGAVRFGGDVDKRERSLWDSILQDLKKEYFTTDKPERPADFNIFRDFATTSKEYLGLIYADANNMGTEIEGLKTLNDVNKFSKDVDDTVTLAMCAAIKQHLPIVTGIKNGDEETSSAVFPFDILLLGGDDVLMVTEASKAIDVALTLAEQFRAISEEKRHGKGRGYTLSVGVVLAPVKYPFGLLLDHVEGVLKLAKKAGAKAKQKEEERGHKDFDATYIDFRVLTGGGHIDLERAYESGSEDEKVVNQQPKFYATLRPYTTPNLTHLLKTIRRGHTLNLGRTKLHQLREAVLQMNLTTSVRDGQALLRNWRLRQREFVARQVYEFGGLADVPKSPNINISDPFAGFPRVTFPWFWDSSVKNHDIYRTPLLDFVELYDFVSREGDAPDDESE